jgi:hypothetical protein
LATLWIAGITRRIKLLHKAADAAEANSRQALETVQKLSSQLCAAEDRIAALEAELQLNRDKADRAEGWLSKISTEIEDRLIKKPEEKRREVSQRLKSSTLSFHQ